MDPMLRGFELYWKNWNAVEGWRQRHRAASSAASNAQNFVFLPNNLQENFVTVADHSFIDEETERYGINGFDDSSDNGNNEDEELELEFVVNEEMIAFLEQSMRHKMELKQQRALLKRERHSEIDANVPLEDSFINKEKNSKVKKKQSTNKTWLPSLSTYPPNINVSGQKRIEEMNSLYGDSAPKMCGMETALQLSFNRLCDHSKPIYWPCIPFRP